MTEPRVTVCIPTYARTEWLAEAIQSVLGQTYRDYILLIGDDGTPGDTIRPVVEAFDDPRIRFLRFEDNAGIVGSFNRLLDLSKTEYVLQIGDDDVLEPELLEATVEALDRHPHAGLAHSRFDRIDASGAVLEHDVDLTGGLEGDTVESGATFIRASMLQSWGRVCTTTALLRRAAMPPWGFRQEYAPPFDFACWLEMARSWDIAFIARTLCRYRLHERSFTTSNLEGLAGVHDIHRVKRAFIDRHYPPGPERRALERMADGCMRRELVVRVRLDTLPERRFRPTLRALARFARDEPSLLREPAAWSLLAGSVVGQRGVSALRRLVPARPRS